jgi:hypothetical protein
VADAAAPAAPAPAPSARPADAVLGDYVRAVGGEAAWNRHKTVRLRREILVKGMQLTGTEERRATSAGRFLSVMTLPGIGEFKEGSDGKRAWMMDPINGLRLLAGAEAEEARIDATWNADLKLKKLYRTVLPAPTPADPPRPGRFECLELSPKLGEATTVCFDAETHLRAFQRGTRTTPQGRVPYTVVFSDWRDVGGLKIPHREELSAGPMTIEGRLVEVKFDEPAPASLFKLPKPPK